MESTYKVKVNMGWEFIITSNDKDMAMDKLNDYLDQLFVKDGFSAQVFSAKENIKNKDYTIEDYDGFVIV